MSAEGAAATDALLLSPSLQLALLAYHTVTPALRYKQLTDGQELATLASDAQVGGGWVRVPG